MKHIHEVFTAFSNDSNQIEPGKDGSRLRCAVLYAGARDMEKAKEAMCAYAVGLGIDKWAQGAGAEAAADPEAESAVRVTGEDKTGFLKESKEGMDIAFMYMNLDKELPRMVHRISKSRSSLSEDPDELIPGIVTTIADVVDEEQPGGSAKADGGIQPTPTSGFNEGLDEGEFAILLHQLLQKSKVMKVVKELFNLLDEDGDGVIEFQEFKYLFDLLDLVITMSLNPIFAAALNLESAQRNLLDLTEQKAAREQEAMYVERYAHHEKMRKGRGQMSLELSPHRQDSRRKQHKTEMRKMEKSMASMKKQIIKKTEDFKNIINKEEGKADKVLNFKEDSWNAAWAALVLVHMALMSMYGIEFADVGVLHVPNFLFLTVYLLELFVKCYLFSSVAYNVTLGGGGFTAESKDQTTPRKYWVDSIGNTWCPSWRKHIAPYFGYLTHPHSSRKTTMRRLDATLVTSTWIIALSFEFWRASPGYPGDDSENTHILFAVMGCIFIRLFILMEDVSLAIYSFFKGWEALANYGVILLLLMYEFACWFTWQFKDTSTSFNSIENSMLILGQMLIGEGWHEIMYNTIDAEADVWIWAFFLYVMVISVLFSQLFVGFIIEMFDSYYEHRTQDTRQKQTAYAVLEHLGTNSSKEDVDGMVHLLRRVHWLQNMEAQLRTQEAERHVEHIEKEVARKMLDLSHAHLDPKKAKEVEDHWNFRNVNQMFILWRCLLECKRMFKKSMIFHRENMKRRAARGLDSEWGDLPLPPPMPSLAGSAPYPTGTAPYPVAPYPNPAGSCPPYPRAHSGSNLPAFPAGTTGTGHYL